MTVTRSKTGSTPRKPENPGFVETPRPRTARSSGGGGGGGRKSEVHVVEPVVEITQVAKSATNGSAKSPVRRRSSSKKPLSSSSSSSSSSKKAAAAVEDHRVDDSGEYEFGGAVGVTAMMVGFPLLMYYMWLGATYYDGAFPRPAPGQDTASFLRQMGSEIYEGAFPTAKAWAIYWTFFIVEGVFYLYMPGVYTYGKPLAHLGGKKLKYYCSGMTSFYTTIALAGLLHFTRLFPLWTLMDEFGPLMSVAIISGFAVSVVAYVSALARGAQHRMTGSFLYDFFMGAELNPRMFEWLDFKMFFEVRLPWFILFLVTLGACARQYEQYGFVSGELGFLLMAHFLYANACCKGEEMITTTWDMYYEKWGFMLIFWNLAGVPLSYCHCTIYLANHDPAVYRWPRWFLAALTVSYLFAYWVWDTCGSQKNHFRAQQRGTAQHRATFPQLPWRNVGPNPVTIPVESGDDLLCDGWYKYGRKLHYTADVWFAICWGLVTGFGSPFPWFYPVFFCLMIAHRARRDIARCRQRYGAAWEEYERRVPYLFIPHLIR